jgi:hypothetical protein
VIGGTVPEQKSGGLLEGVNEHIADMLARLEELEAKVAEQDKRLKLTRALPSILRGLISAVLRSKTLEEAQAHAQEALTKAEWESQQS